MQPPQHLWRHRVSMPSMARHKRYAAMAHYLLREHCPIRHCMHTSRGTLCPGFHLLRIQSRMQPAILHSQAHPRHWRLDSRHRTVHVRVGRRPVSMCACLHCWSSQPRDFIVYAATLPMRRTSMTVRVRCVSGLPTSAAASRSACQYTRSLPANIQEAASPGVSVRSCRGSGSIYSLAMRRRHPSSDTFP